MRPQALRFQARSEKVKLMLWSGGGKYPIEDHEVKSQERLNLH